MIAQNNRLGGGSVGINVGGDETDVQKEHFGRNVQRILRGEEAELPALGHCHRPQPGIPG